MRPLPVYDRKQHTASDLVNLIGRVTVDGGDRWPPPLLVILAAHPRLVDAGSRAPGREGARR
jgi:hypothetical protein